MADFAIILDTYFWTIIISIITAIGGALLGSHLSNRSNKKMNRTKQEQKQEISIKNKAERTKERNRVVRANTLIDYGSRPNSYFLIGPTDSSAIFFTLDKENDRVNIVIGGSIHKDISKLCKILEKNEMVNLIEINDKGSQTRDDTGKESK